MDEVINQLKATDISKNDVKSNFDDLYKFKERYGGQEQRRKDLLDKQKSNRSKNMDLYRGIMDLENSMSDYIFRAPIKNRYKPTILVSGFNKLVYKEVLMLSEWMTEKPCDLEKNWLVMPCPKGTRTIVIASDGCTKVFSRYGHFMFQCSTLLPGGNSTILSKSFCCVLDCIYDKNSSTMYVLDILSWNSQPMTDGECEFRYFWLKTYVAELDGISVLSKRNKLIFNILQKYPCYKKSLNNVMQTYHYFKPDVALDGLLFYHKNAHYVSGESPVSVWLYAFMVPEIIDLDITVNPAHMLEKPVNYTTQADYIKKFELRLAKKKSKAWQSLRNRRRANIEMDTHDNRETLEISKEKYDTPKIESMEAEIDKDQKSETMLSVINIEKLESETMDSEIVNDEIPKSETLESDTVSRSNENVDDGMEAESITNVIK